MICALDLDDTVTACPAFFSLLARALRAGGHKVFVLTLRRDPALAADDLAELDVDYDDLEVLPASWPGDPAAWKAKRCRELAVDVLVDDSVEIARLVDPGTFVLVPRDPTLGILTYSDSSA